MSAARIGKITLKNGGAVVRLLRQETPNRDGSENWAGRMITSARNAADFVPSNGPVAGFMVAAFYADGSTWFDFRWGEESPFNRALLPGYVADVIRRDMIAAPQAADVFDEMFGRT